MNPAEELAAAADKLRALLANPELTPGPWLSLDHGDRMLYDGPGAEDQPPVYVIDEPMSNGANAYYIEAMHPGVGAALARSLTAAADLATAYPGLARDHDRKECDDYACDLMGQTVALARQILGTAP